MKRTRKNKLHIDIMDTSRRWLEKYNNLEGFRRDGAFYSKYETRPAERPANLNDFMDKKDVFGASLKLDNTGYFPHSLSGNRLKYTEPTKDLFDTLIANKHHDKTYDRDWALKKGFPIYEKDKKFYFVPYRGHPLYFENNVRPDKSLEVISVGGRSTNVRDKKNMYGFDDTEDFLRFIRRPRVYGERSRFRNWTGDTHALSYKSGFIFKTPTLNATKDYIKYATPDEAENLKSLRALLSLQKKKIEREKNAKRQKEMVERYLTNVSIARRAVRTGRIMARPRKRLNIDPATKYIGYDVKFLDEKYKGYRATLAKGRTGARRRKHPNPTKFNDMNRKRPDFYQKTTEREGTTARVDGSERRGFTQQYDRGVKPRFMGLKELSRTSLTSIRPEYAPRGIRDPRTYRGEAREARRRLLNDKRYISATEQAIIDRKIRNTEAEAKREKDIKSVRDASKKKEDELRLRLEAGEKIQKDLTKQNQGLIHSHDMLGRMKSNATLIGSNAELLNEIIARGGAYMAMLKSMVRNGEISKNGTIAGLNISDDEKRRLFKILKEGNEYQEGQQYFFKEITPTGEVKIFKGKLREGGERGSNLKLELADGRRKVVRTRDIITPDEASKLRLKPGVLEGEFVSGGRIAERDFREIQQALEADESAVGVWLGQQQEHASSTESSIASLEGGGTGYISADEPPPLEAVGTPEGEARGIFSELTGNLIPNKERQRARIQQQIDLLEVEDEASRIRIRELVRLGNEVDDELRFNKGRANKISSDIGLDKPYPTSVEDFEASRLALQSILEATPPAERDQPEPETTLDDFLAGLEEEGGEIGGGLPAGLGDGAGRVEVVAEEEPVEPVIEERPPPIEEEDFSFSRSEWNTKDLKQRITSGAGDDKVMLWSTKYPTEWREREGGVKGIYLTRSELEQNLVDAGITGKSKDALLTKWDKARGGKVPEFAFNNQKVLQQLGLMKKTGPDQRSFTGQLE